MVLVDGIVCGVTLLSTAVSTSRGFVREVLSLVAWGISAVCLVLGLDPLAKLLLIYNLQSPLNWVVAVVLICVAVWLMVRFINSGIRLIFKGLGITWFDNLLGGLFGVMRGLLLSYLMVWGVMLMLGPDHQWISEAKAPHWLNQWSDSLQETNWEEVVEWMEPIAPYLDKIKMGLQSSPTTVASNASMLAKHVHDS